MVCSCWQGERAQSDLSAHPLQLSTAAVHLSSAQAHHWPGRWLLVSSRIAAARCATATSSISSRIPSRGCDATADDQCRCAPHIHAEWLFSASPLPHTSDGVISRSVPAGARYSAHCIRIDATQAQLCDEVEPAIGVEAAAPPSSTHRPFDQHRLDRTDSAPFGRNQTDETAAPVGKLHRGRWRRDGRLLASLCILPHSLQLLQEIHLRHTVVNEAMLAELAHLPTLCKLEPLCLLPCAYPLLPRLPQLRGLRLRLNSDTTSAPLAGNAVATYPTLTERNALCTALIACRHLAELTIEACKDADLLASFLPSLLQSTPVLRSLRLDTVNVHSLSFLSAAPQLEALYIQECWPRLSGAEVFSIRTPRLETLHLVNAAVLSGAQLSELCPPSALWPSLRDCHYR